MQVLFMYVHILVGMATCEVQNILARATKHEFAPLVKPAHANNMWKVRFDGFYSYSFETGFHFSAWMCFFFVLHLTEFESIVILHIIETLSVFPTIPFMFP